MSSPKASLTAEEHKTTQRRTTHQRDGVMEFFVGLLYPFAVTYIVLFVVDYVLRASTDALLQGDLSNAFNPIFDLAIVAGSVSFIVYKIRKLGPMVKMNRFTAFFIGELMGTVLSLALLWFTSGIL